MSTPLRRVRRLLRAIAELQPGDLYAVFDLDHLAANYNEHFGPEEVDDPPLSGEDLGRDWEHTLGVIERLGRTERWPPLENPPWDGL